MGDNRISSSELKKICSTLTVLYVEDDDDTRDALGSILTNLFQKVVIAKDGKEGLESFKKEDFDLIITDIEMPKLDGLEMSQAIKDIDSEQKIIITTAYSDNKYYEEAIDIGVDSFILKPIQLEKVYVLLYKSAKKIINEQEAQYYKKFLEERVKEEVFQNQKKDQETIEVFNNLLTAYPNPIVLIDDSLTLKFINQASKNSFNIEDNCTIDEFDKLFESYNGEKATLTLLKEKKKEICAIKSGTGKKIYKVIYSNVVIKDLSYVMLTLNDITREEYQKIKINNYSQRLGDLIIQSRRKVKNVTSNVVAKESISEPEIVDKVPSSRLIDKNEQNILRKSHQELISAIDYIDDVDDYILEQVSELEDLEQDALDIMFDLDATVDIEKIKKVFEVLLKFGSTISLLFEFEDLSFAIKGVSNLEEKLENSHIEEKKFKNFTVILKSIIEDLSMWRKNIFIDKEANNIHYLDSSLFSSCLQLEMILTGDLVDDDEDDLELF